MEKFIHTEKKTGTGAAITITAGFKPSYVEVLNAEGLCLLKHNAAMAAASGYKILTGIDATSDTVSKHSFITTGGITLTDTGCIIGTDTDINVSGEDLYITCFR